MKKILLVVVAMLCVATVSAQSKFESSVKQAAQTVASQKWAVGLRVGSGLQADVEWLYSGDKYVEARLGMAWVSGIGADFTILHNWNCCNWNWTPSVATWYLDAGVGLNVGGSAHIATLGVAGQVKFGMKFKKVPIRLALDFTPAFGPRIGYGNGEVYGADFYTNGICNLGASATFCF